MDWLDRMNRAMDYMETHLADEISYEEIAQEGLLLQLSLPADVPLHHRRAAVGVYPAQKADAGRV